MCVYVKIEALAKQHQTHILSSWCAECFPNPEMFISAALAILSSVPMVRITFDGKEIAFWEYLQKNLFHGWDVESSLYF